MRTQYPGGLTQWRRTPFRIRHRLLALAINNALGRGAPAPTGAAAAPASARITNAIGGGSSR
jgi:hypothetical protein